MRNLAGDEGADASVRDELNAVSVPIVLVPVSGEVPTKYEGKLGSFTFRRCWYYWSVGGHVPAHVARELYDHPIGAADVRVDGHCGKPAPTGAVNSYHIDSAAGLRLFVDTIRKHGLV